MSVARQDPSLLSLLNEEELRKRPIDCAVYDAAICLYQIGLTPERLRRATARVLESGRLFVAGSIGYETYVGIFGGAEGVCYRVVTPIAQRVLATEGIESMCIRHGVTVEIGGSETDFIVRLASSEGDPNKPESGYITTSGKVVVAELGTLTTRLGAAYLAHTAAREEILTVIGES